MSSDQHGGLSQIISDKSLRDKAYRALKDAIVGTDIYENPGEVRLDERTLSQQLGVSRTPIREALGILEYQGFVRNEPRRGIFIVKKNKDEIVEMIFACVALESMAVRLACAKATDAQLEALPSQFRIFYESDAPHEFESYFEARWRFCRHIANLAQCREIDVQIDHLLLHLRSAHDVMFRQDIELRYLRSAYVSIISALQDRDAELGTKLVYERGSRLARDISGHADRFGSGRVK